MQGTFRNFGEFCLRSFSQAFGSKKITESQVSKRIAESRFWRAEIDHYVEWYRGNRTHYETPPPREAEKVVGYDEKSSAILTWFELHQIIKYRADLQLSENFFRGKKILDLGSGPFPNGLAFLGAEVYSLDPLLPDYLQSGFPIHSYDQRAKFVMGKAEQMPFSDQYFDAVISVNAIDHVDNFEQTAQEIRRVLKAEGKLRMHVHYHRPTIAEPIEIDDSRLRQAFSWVNNLTKISESKLKTGHELRAHEESYVLWSNFS